MVLFFPNVKLMSKAFVDPPFCSECRGRVNELLEPRVLSHFWACAVNKAISDLRMARVSKPV